MMVCGVYLKRDVFCKDFRCLPLLKSYDEEERGGSDISFSLKVDKIKTWSEMSAKVG